MCTTELGYMATIKPEFDQRNTKIIGLSVDPLDNHVAWADDIAETQGTAPNYPMISDNDYTILKAYGMLLRRNRRRPDQSHSGRDGDAAQCLRHRPR